MDNLSPTAMSNIVKFMYAAMTDPTFRAAIGSFNDPVAVRTAIDQIGIEPLGGTKAELVEQICGVGSGWNRMNQIRRILTGIASAGPVT